MNDPHYTRDEATEAERRELRQVELCVNSYDSDELYFMSDQAPSREAYEKLRSLAYWRFKTEEAQEFGP